MSPIGKWLLTNCDNNLYIPTDHYFNIYKDLSYFEFTKSPREIAKELGVTIA